MGKTVSMSSKKVDFINSAQNSLLHIEYLKESERKWSWPI